MLGKSFRQRISAKFSSEKRLAVPISVSQRMRNPCTVGEMASIGKFNTLAVTRETASGYYLDAGDLGEVLLPGSLAPRDLEPGGTLEVFLYSDSEDRLVATTEKPRATVDQFAALKVLAIHPQVGAFLDWGLGKDLLLPFREQGERHVRAGERVVVFIKLDERSHRIVATTKLNRYLSKVTDRYAPGHRVRFLVARRTPLGYHAVVDGRYSGLVYHSDLGTALVPGQEIDGYVRAVRPGGGIDLCLDPPGPGRFKDVEEKVMVALKKHGGRLPFDDTSSPESIRETFHTSKKTFKKALSTLYKQRRIRFPDGGGIERV